MRRVFAFVVLLSFLFQIPASALAATPHRGVVTPLSLQLEASFQPISAMLGDFVAALSDPGLYVLEHQPVPNRVRHRSERPAPLLDNRPHRIQPHMLVGTRVLPRVPNGILPAIPDPLAVSHGQRKVTSPPVRMVRAAATLPPPSGQSALPSATTGANPWWTYEEGAIAGVGKWMVNVNNGNLLMQATDVDIPERGIDLAFRRTYNRQSQHDAANSDGSIPSEYGNGWTNFFDMHVAYNATQNVMSVYDGDGARYDYTPDGNGGWIAPAGVHEKLTFDGCIYTWLKKSGTMYRMYAPYATTCVGASQSALFGRIANIYARNLNNHLLFGYTLGNATDPSTLASIAVMHSDGQQLLLSFAKFGTNTELRSITLPNGLNIIYSFDGGGNLVEVDRPAIASGVRTFTMPSGQSYTSAVIPEGYGYGANNDLEVVCGPREALAARNGFLSGGAPTDGSCLEAWYDTQNRTTDVKYAGVLDFTPNDATATTLQPTADTTWHWYYHESFYYNLTNSRSEPATQIADTDGHAREWGFDSSGRVITTQEWINGGFNLATLARWDVQNNVIATVDPRGNETDYGYDANGNTLWVQQPQVQTSLGAGRPVARYAYDQFNNLLAYCDPQYVWSTGAQTCTPGAGTTNYAWDYSDVNWEPYGKLTDIYTPLGYHTQIAYNTPIGDVGLPSSVTSQSFLQNDGTTVAPQQTFGYDAYGNLTSYSKGYGAWALAYDNMNRVTSVTDPDNVTDYTCYNVDGTVSAKQSALQHSLDGTVCGANSTAYTYDADGNVITESHHYGGTPGTTTKWYDGADRLVEVSLPAGDTTDYQGHGLTRYLYDLTQNGFGAANLAFAGATATYSAHGGLYKTQACYATGPIVCPNWTDLKGQAFDNLDRLVTRYQHIPGQSTIAQYTSTYDNDPTTYGLLSYSTDAMNVRTTHTYDASGKETQVSFSDTVTPGRNYTYDPDGRPTQITSTVYGGVTYTYDQDGRLTSKQETAGSGMSSPALITYGYYPNGWRSSLSVSSQALTQQNLFQYAYRNDGKRTWLLPAYNNNNVPFRWTYTNAGRATSQTDPLTGAVVQQTSAYPASGGTVQSFGTLAAEKWSYDIGTSTNTGELTTLTLPMGNAYTAITRDPEGNVSQTNLAPAQPLASGSTATSVGNLYDARGQLSETALGINGGAPDYSNTQGQRLQQNTYTAGSTCQYNCGIAIVDYPTGASLKSQTSSTGAIAKMTYDTNGRMVTKAVTTIVKNIANTTTTTNAFDAENHTSSQTIDASDGGQNGGAYGWGPEGHPVTSYVGTLTMHWDGDELLFATSNSTGTPIIAFVGIEKLGWYQDPSLTQPAHTLWVMDRDYAGQTAQEHTPTLSYAWQYAPPRSSPGASKTYGAPYSQGGALIDADRTDGYQIGDVTFQGVRAFDADTSQWTTPDAYQGEVHDPMSQRSYMWNDNNPVAYTDPSGYETGATSIYDAPGVSVPSQLPNASGDQVIDSMLIVGAVVTDGLSLTGLGRGGEPAEEPGAPPASSVGRPGTVGNPAESSGGPGAGRAFSQTVKDQAAAAAGNRCVYCGTQTRRGAGSPSTQETDHGIAKSLGGNNTLGNANNACRTCNRVKRTTPASQFIKRKR